MWLGAAACVGVSIFYGWHQTQLTPTGTSGVTERHARTATSLVIQGDLKHELGPFYKSEPLPTLLTIDRHQTFYEALVARGVSHEDIMSIVNDTKKFRDLRRVKSGQVFRVQITANGKLQSLGYDLDEESYLTWNLENNHYTRYDGTYPVEHRLRGVSGTIATSLYASLATIGAPLSLAPKMNDILGWEIDFQRDLRPGDTYEILYDEIWRDGKLIRTGVITALNMVNRGHEHTAFLFSEGDRPHYYDAEGHNMQKQLSRAPLVYSRISDRFTRRRYHPVLKRWMPHLGVDYAAPLGTPVRAGGDGVIAVATRKKGNGRYIRIKHTNSDYETYYLHLSRFAKGIVPGKRVNQGQLIGYVGATGYATGPHLDYRVKRRGKFVDPRRLKLPAAAPVPADMHEDFAALVASHTATLKTLIQNRAITIVPHQAQITPDWLSNHRAQPKPPLVVRGTSPAPDAHSAARSPATASH